MKMENKNVTLKWKQQVLLVKLPQTKIITTVVNILKFKVSNNFDFFQFINI